MIVRGAFDADVAAACRALIWDFLAGRAIRDDDPATWPLAELGGLTGEPFTGTGSSPILAGACNELIGPRRWISPVACGTAVVVRFPPGTRRTRGTTSRAATTARAATGSTAGPRRTAAGAVPVSDVGRDDAPTRLVRGSHLAVPQFLAAYCEAGTHADAEFWRSSTLCLPVAHATGRAGDIYLCHPFIVHTATWPHRGAMPLMIAQPAGHVRDGFAIDRSDPSPVAKAIVAGLARAD